VGRGVNIETCFCVVFVSFRTLVALAQSNPIIRRKSVYFFTFLVCAYSIRVSFFCDVSLVESCDDPQNWSEVDLARKMEEIGLQVRPGFATQQEQLALVEELDNGPLKKQKYQKGHWDGVIADYKETERLSWKSSSNERVIGRMKSLFPPDWGWQATHILDLEKSGEISPHVDALATVGDVVCGLSLLSSCVMTFEAEDEAFNVLLRPGTVYIMAGESRFRFKHSIARKSQIFKGQSVERSRRVSVMIRDFPMDSPFKFLGKKNVANHN
jgi:alkylated DNA repair protein alkB family protein 7